MKSQKRSLLEVGIVLALILVVAIGCSENLIDNNGNSPTEPEWPTADPGPGNLAGQVVGTINGRPLVGVTVSARGKTTVTDSDGLFELDGVGEGGFGVVISSNNIYTRVETVNTANGRFVRFDAIEKSSTFNLGFYRELARGSRERKMTPTQRRTNPIPPTFYINTNASATLKKVIDQGQINAVRGVIAQIVPIFSGNFYSSVLIEIRAFPQFNNWSDIPDNSFVISFDDTIVEMGAIGLTFTESDLNKSLSFIVDNSQFYDAITMEELAAHEFGHGFGFYDTTTLLPSVMVYVGAFGGLYSDADKLHMKVMYSRPAGNTDIDTDPVPGAKMMGRPFGVQVFIDRRANFPKSAELMERIRSLPRNPLLSRYVAEYK